MCFIVFATLDGAADPAESLKLLRRLRTEQVPPLLSELLAYLATQARFILAMARQYQGQSVVLTQLLKAGQQGLIRLWEISSGNQAKMDQLGSWWVRQAMLTVIQADTQPVPRRHGLFASYYNGHELYLYYRGRLIFKK